MSDLAGLASTLAACGVATAAAAAIARTRVPEPTRGGARKRAGRAFDALAAKCADAMLTTRRVAEDGEDPSMAILRPVLSSINRQGLITVDSQRGTERRYQILESPWLTATSWERVYIEGFMLRQRAHALRDTLASNDCVLVLVGEFGTAADLDSLPRVPVTLEQDKNGTYKSVTAIPIGAKPFDDAWINMLPDLRDEIDDDLLFRRIRPHVVGVTIVDMRWNRQDSLFYEVDEALRGNARPMPELAMMDAAGPLERAHARGERTERAPPGAAPNAEYERSIVDAIATVDARIEEQGDVRDDGTREYVENMSRIGAKLRDDLASYRAMFA